MRLIVVFVARGWLVLEMTDSPFWVGLAPALRGLVQIALGAFSGVLLDRVNRRLLLIVAEVGNSLIALGIGVLVLSGRIELWHIMAASLVEGVFVSVRWPAINTMLYETVGPSRVLNASAAQFLGFNLGNIAASAIAGLVINALGIGSGYLLAAAVGLIGAACVWFVRGEFRPKLTQASFRRSLLSGINYILQSGPLRRMLTMSFLISLLGWSHISLMPVIARDVLGVDASGLGFLSMAGGIGAFIATSLLAGQKGHRNKLHLVMYLAAITAVMLILFAFSPWYGLSLLTKAVLQGSLMSFEATFTAVILLLTSEAMQGRVQGIYSLIFGFTWLGGVVLGTIATITSAPLAIGMGGVSIGLVTVLLWRPIRQIELAETGD
jgi:MFS family permease